MSVRKISYSAWKEWMSCPFKHKLMKIDGIRLFNGNAFSSFGKAIHSTAEKMLILEKETLANGGVKDDSFDAGVFFLGSFKKELDLLDEESKKLIDRSNGWRDETTG